MKLRSMAKWVSARTVVTLVFLIIGSIAAFGQQVTGTSWVR